ncbi:MAG: flagellar protein FlbB [Xanthobacteraceae bacterium]
MSARRDIRVLPVVLAAVAGLAVLKVAGLVVDGSYVLGANAGPRSLSWAQENLNYPASRDRLDAAEVTGSVEAKPKPEPKQAPPSAAVPETVAPAPDAAVSPTERAVLERLQERRQELDARAREIEIRESLLKAAEQRIEARAEDVKTVEGRIAAAKSQQAAAEEARFKAIVTMYEGMKPKEAARIFDRLDMPVLIEVTSRIAPRKMADILGVMQPAAAERLTVELARRAGADSGASIASLPKIEGQPTPSGGH